MELVRISLTNDWQTGNLPVANRSRDEIQLNPLQRILKDLKILSVIANVGNEKHMLNEQRIYIYFRRNFVTCGSARAEFNCSVSSLFERAWGALRVESYVHKHLSLSTCFSLGSLLPSYRIEPNRSWLIQGKHRNFLKISSALLQLRHQDQGNR